MIIVALAADVALGLKPQRPRRLCADIVIFFHSILSFQSRMATVMIL